MPGTGWPGFQVQFLVGSFGAVVSLDLTDAIPSPMPLLVQNPKSSWVSVKPVWSLL